MKTALVLAAGAALSAAAPLAGQATDGSTFPHATQLPAWFAVHPAGAADPRLALPSRPLIAAAGDHWKEAGPRLSLPALALVGAAAGCVAGALVMGSGAEEGEVAAVRFNGCILGGAAGMFLGGVYSLVAGA